MSTALVSSILESVLGRYLDGLSKEISVSIMGGDLSAKNLRLKPSALEELDLPVIVKAGSVGALNMKFNVFRLGSEPIRITMDDVYLLVTPLSPTSAAPSSDPSLVSATSRTKARLLFRQELWRELEAGGSNEQANKKEGSRLEKLGLAIAANLQLTIRRLHVHYEDALTNPELPFSAGVTIKELRAVSTNRDGAVEFVSPAADANGSILTHKLVGIDELSVYWNSDEAALWSTLAPAALLSAFSSYFAKPAKRKHRFDLLLHPFSGEGRVTLNLNKTDVHAPQQQASVRLEPLRLSIRKRQYGDIMCLMERMSRFQMEQDIHEFMTQGDIPARPLPIRSFPPRARGLVARAWWRYVGHIFVGIARVRKRNEQWRHRQESDDQFREEYIRVYSRHVEARLDPEADDAVLTDPLGGLSPKQRDTLNRLRALISLESLTAFEQEAYDAVQNRLAKQRRAAAKRAAATAPASGGWFTGVYSAFFGASSAPAASAAPTASPTPSPPSSPTPTPSVTSTAAPSLEDLERYTKQDLSLEASSIEIELIDGNHPIASIGTSGAITFVGREDSSSTSFSLNSFSFRDERESTKHYRSLLHSTSPASPSSTALLTLDVDSNPLDMPSFIKTSVRMNLRSVEFIYNARFIADVVNFFDNSEAVAMMSAAAQNVAEEVKGNITALAKTTDPRSLHIDVHIGAPLLLIPESFDVPDSRVLIVDMGRFHLRSRDSASADSPAEAATSAPDNPISSDDEMRITPQLFDPDLLEQAVQDHALAHPILNPSQRPPSERIYSKFMLDIREVAVRIVPGAARHDAAQDNVVAILEPCDIIVRADVLADRLHHENKAATILLVDVSDLQLSMHTSTIHTLRHIQQQFDSPARPSVPSTPVDTTAPTTSDTATEDDDGDDAAAAPPRKSRAQLIEDAPAHLFDWRVVAPSLRANLIDDDNPDHVALPLLGIELLDFNAQGIIHPYMSSTQMQLQHIQLHDSVGQRHFDQRDNAEWITSPHSCTTQPLPPSFLAGSSLPESAASPSSSPTNHPFITLRMSTVPPTSPLFSSTSSLMRLHLDTLYVQWNPESMGEIYSYVMNTVLAGPSSPPPPPSSSPSSPSAPTTPATPSTTHLTATFDRFILLTKAPYLSPLDNTAIQYVDFFQLQLSQFNLGMTLAPGRTCVCGWLADLSLLDLVNTDTRYREIIATTPVQADALGPNPEDPELQDAVNSRLVTFNVHLFEEAPIVPSSDSDSDSDAEDEPQRASKTQVSAQLQSLRIVYSQQSFSELIQYFQQAITGALFEAVETSIEDSITSAPALRIELLHPLVIIPESLTSPHSLEIDLGRIGVANSVQRAKHTPCIETRFHIFTEDFRVWSVCEPLADDPRQSALSAERLPLLTRVDATIDMTSVNLSDAERARRRSLSPAEVLALQYFDSSHFEISLTAVKMTLGREQYAQLVAIAMHNFAGPPLERSSRALRKQSSAGDATLALSKPTRFEPSSIATTLKLAEVELLMGLHARAPLTLKPVASFQMNSMTLDMRQGIMGDVKVVVSLDSLKLTDVRETSANSPYKHLLAPLSEVVHNEPVNTDSTDDSLISVIYSTPPPPLPVNEDGDMLVAARAHGQHRSGEEAHTLSVHIANPCGHLVPEFVLTLVDLVSLPSTDSGFGPAGSPQPEPASDDSPPPAASAPRHEYKVFMSQARFVLVEDPSDTLSRGLIASFGLDASLSFIPEEAAPQAAQNIPSLRPFADLKWGHSRGHVEAVGLSLFICTASNPMASTTHTVLRPCDVVVSGAISSPICDQAHVIVGNVQGEVDPITLVLSHQLLKLVLTVAGNAQDASANLPHPRRRERLGIFPAVYNDDGESDDSDSDDEAKFDDEDDALSALLAVDQRGIAASALVVPTQQHLLVEGLEVESSGENADQGHEPVRQLHLDGSLTSNGLAVMFINDWQGRLAPLLQIYSPASVVTFVSNERESAVSWNWAIQANVFNSRLGEWECLVGRTEWLLKVHAHTGGATPSEPGVKVNLEALGLMPVHLSHDAIVTLLSAASAWSQYSSETASRGEHVAGDAMPVDIPVPVQSVSGGVDVADTLDVSVPGPQPHTGGSNHRLSTFAPFYITNDTGCKLSYWFNNHKFDLIPHISERDLPETKWQIEPISLEPAQQLLQVWNDSGSKASCDVSIWRPQLPADYVMFGDHAQLGHSRGSSTVLIARDHDAFVPPSDFVCVFAQTNGKVKLYVWEPRAPSSEYIALGHVISTSSSPPNNLKHTVRCVHGDWLREVQGGFESRIWDNRGRRSSAKPGSFWSVLGVNTFVASPTTGDASPPRRAHYTFNNSSSSLETRYEVAPGATVPMELLTAAPDFLSRQMAFDIGLTLSLQAEPLASDSVAHHRWTEVTDVHISKVGRVLRPVSDRANGRPLAFLDLNVEARDGSKFVTVSSQLKVCNHSSLSLEFSQPGSRIVHGPIVSGSSASVPASENWNELQLRPVAGTSGVVSSFAFSQPAPISAETLATRLIKCDPKMAGAPPLYFHLHQQLADTSAASANALVCRTLHIRAPVTLCNLLSCGLRFRVRRQGESVAAGMLKSGRVEPVHSLCLAGRGTRVSVEFDVQGMPTSSGDIVLALDGDSDGNGSTQRIAFEVKDGAGMSTRLHLLNEPGPAFTRVLRVFAEVWFVNKTEQSLVYALHQSSKKGSKSAERRMTLRDNHPSTTRLWHQPDKAEDALLYVAEPTTYVNSSSPVQFTGAQVDGVIQVPRGAGMMDLAVHFDRLTNAFRRTKIVTFLPRLVLVNRMATPLVLSQCGTSDEVQLLPDEEVPFHWSLAEARPMVSVRFRGWHASFPFTLDDVDEFTVKLVSESASHPDAVPNESVFGIRVKVAPVRAQLIVSFMEEKYRVPPLRVANHTSFVVGVRQKLSNVSLVPSGAADEGESDAASPSSGGAEAVSPSILAAVDEAASAPWPFLHVPPKSSIPYTWEALTDSARVLSVWVGDKIMETPLDDPQLQTTLTMKPGAVDISGQPLERVSYVRMRLVDRGPTVVVVLEEIMDDNGDGGGARRAPESVPLAAPSAPVATAEADLIESLFTFSIPVVRLTVSDKQSKSVVNMELANFVIGQALSTYVEQLTIQAGALLLDNPRSDAHYQTAVYIEADKGAHSQLKIIRHRTAPLRLGSKLERRRRRRQTQLISYKFVGVRMLPVDLSIDSSMIVNLMTFSSALSDDIALDASRRAMDPSLAAAAAARSEAAGELVSAFPFDAQQWTGLNASGQRLKATTTSAASDGTLVFVERLQFDAVRAQLSFEPSQTSQPLPSSAVFLSSSNPLASMVAIRDVPIRLSSLRLWRVLERPGDLNNQVVAHYKSQVVSKSLPVMFGSLQLLGNPVRLVSKVGGGFVTFAKRTSQADPFALPRLMSSTVNAVTEAASGVLSQVGAVTGALMIDKRSKERRARIKAREQRENKNVAHGVKFGAEYVGKGVANAIGDIFRNPVKEAKKAKGAKKFLKGGLGFFKAVLNAPVQIATGVVDGGAAVVRGAGRTFESETTQPKVAAVGRAALPLPREMADERRQERNRRDKRARRVQSHAAAQG